MPAEQSGDVFHRPQPAVAAADAVAKLHDDEVGVVAADVPDALPPCTAAGCRHQVWALTPHHGEQLTHHQRGVIRHVLAVLPVVRHHLLVEGDRVVAADAEVEIVVGARVDGRVEAACARHEIAPEHHHGRVAHAVSPQERQVGIAALPERLTRGLRNSLAGDEPAVSGGEAEGRVRGQHARAGGERARQKPVVRVEENNQFATRGGQTAVTRGRNPAVLLHDVAHGRKCRGHSRRVVGGAVVHYDDVERIVLLAEHARDGLSEKAGLVVSRNDDRYRPHHHDARREDCGPRASEAGTTRQS